MDGVDGPGLGLPGPRGEQAARVAAPGGAGPAQALGEEFGVFAQSRFNACFVRVLDFDLPIVLDHPSGYKVVVVRVEGANPAEKEVLICEPVLK